MAHPVSRRSRKERHQAQRERAVATADLAALEGLAARSPLGAARDCVAVFEQVSAGVGAHPLDGFAAALAGRLRGLGEHAAALGLAVAGRRRTAALRREEALAALGTGDLARARELAAADARLGALLLPALDAVEGRPVAVERRAVPLLERDLRRLSRGVAAVVAAARDGGDRTAALRKLRAALRGVTDQRAWPLRELAGAGELACAPGAAEPPLALLLRSERVVAAPAVVEALVEVAAARGAHALVRQRLAGAGARARAALAGDARGLLAAAFAALEEPLRARELLSQAQAAGAAPLEVERARWVLACKGLDRAPRHRGREQAAAELVAAARRLDALLAPDPDGHAVRAAVAAATALVLGESGAGDLAPLAAAAREHARPVGGLPEALDDALVLAEATTAVVTAPGRALELLAGVLARHPESERAWRLRLDAAREAHDPRAADYVLAAADAIGAPDLIARARAVRRARGVTTPLAGVPPRCTAGRLGLELALALDEAFEVGRATPQSLAGLLDEADALAAHLGPAERAALDAVPLAVACGADRAFVGPLLLRLARARSPEERDARGLTAVVLHGGAGAALVAALPELRRDAGEAPAVELLRALAALDAKAAGKVLLRLGPDLPWAAVAELKASLSAAARPTEQAQRIGAIVGGLAERLRPELDLEALLDGRLPGVEDPEDLEEDAFDPTECDATSEGIATLAMLGADPAALLRLGDADPDRLTALLTRLTHIIERGPSPAAWAEVRRLFQEYGVQGSRSSSSPWGRLDKYRPQSRKKKKKR